MSSFAVNGTTALFNVIDESFNDAGGPIEEITVTLEFDDPSQWGALFSLRSWNVTQRPIPGGDTVYVDIGGGAGQGYLAVDNSALDAHYAVLIGEKLARTTIEPGTLRSVARASFLIVS